MVETICCNELIAQLVHLGLRSGDLVMTHASMRQVGPIDLGARGLIEAQLEAVGSTGTLVMMLGADENEPFDAIRTPVDLASMGVLAEVFRTYPGVQVSDHPADRFGAVGPLSKFILTPAPLHDYHGFGSPLERFVSKEGRVLRLGAPEDTVTLTHFAEYLADIPDKIHVSRRYVRADSGEVWIESLDDNDGIAKWPDGDYFKQIYLDYRFSGNVRTGRVGNCVGELFDAQPFISFAVDWMNRNLNQSVRATN